jgi:hypothetical protein
LIQNITNTKSGRIRNIRSIIGELPITEKQALRLNLHTNQRFSPYLEKCCVRASANVSYENAARDIEYYTGMKISARTQQRMVHRYEFHEIESAENKVKLKRTLFFFPNSEFRIPNCLNQ